MLTDDQSETLTLFQEKADTLRKSRFVRQLNTHGLKISGRWKVGESFEIKREGPDDDAIAAVVLTLRFFIQDNEACSMRNMAKLYAGLAKPSGVAPKFSKARQILNEYLDSSLHPKLIWGAKVSGLCRPSSSIPPKPGSFVGGRELFRRDLLDVAIYGNFSHANPDKRKKYKTIFRHDFFCSTILTEFILTLANMIRVISYVAALNQKVLNPFVS